MHTTASATRSADGPVIKAFSGRPDGYREPPTCRFPCTPQRSQPSPRSVGGLLRDRRGDVEGAEEIRHGEANGAEGKRPSRPTPAGSSCVFFHAQGIAVPSGDIVRCHDSLIIISVAGGHVEIPTLFRNCERHNSLAPNAVLPCTIRRTDGAWRCRSANRLVGSVSGVP